jgi:hypothetical protein
MRALALLTAGRQLSLASLAAHSTLVGRSASARGKHLPLRRSLLGGKYCGNVGWGPAIMEGPVPFFLGRVLQRERPPLVDGLKVGSGEDPSPEYDLEEHVGI